MTYVVRVLSCHGFKAVATFKEKEEAKLFVWFYVQNYWSVEVRFISAHSVHLKWFQKK